MAKFNFNLKDSKSNSETPINLVVRWNKRKLKYATGEYIEPKFWEAEKGKRNFQRAKEVRQFAQFPEFNARLDYLEGCAKTIFRQFLNDNQNRPPQISELKEAFDNKLRMVKESERMDLFEFIQAFIDKASGCFSRSTGKSLAAGTIRVYKNTLVNLKEFSERKRRRIDFDTIDLNFYHDYVDFLSKEKNLSNNTVGRHIKTIKGFLNEALEQGLTTNAAFRSKRFRTLKEETDSIYLSEEELIEMYNLDLTDKPRLERVRDLFLVGCWTGLRFSDFTTLKPEHISENFIEIKTRKTEETVVIPIHRTVRSIMDKYRGRYHNSLPPAISNVKMNKYLKEIGELVAGLDKETKVQSTKGGVMRESTVKKYRLIKTHTARRSFCSNLFKDGVSSITIMKITGHRTERAFLTYIKVTQNENAKILQQHWNKKEQLAI